MRNEMGAAEATSSSTSRSEASDYHYACESEASERLVELLVASGCPHLVPHRQPAETGMGDGAEDPLRGRSAEFGRECARNGSC